MGKRARPSSSSWLAIAHGLLISMLSPIAIYAVYQLELYQDPVKLWWVIGAVWLATTVFVMRAILVWERGAHIIQRSEERDLLDLFHYVHDDLGDFCEYMEQFLQSAYGKSAKQTFFWVNFINDSQVGLSRIVFSDDNTGQRIYSIPPYNDIVLPRNDATAILFSEERHVINRQFLKEINTYSSTPLPGNLVYPLFHEQRGLLGLWCLDIPQKQAETAPPNLVLSMSRFVLENLLVNHLIRSEQREDPQDTSSTVISYQQIVNLINIVLHEVNTPIAVIRNTVLLMQHGIRLSAEQISQVDEMVDRLYKRMSKLALYANTIGSKETSKGEMRIGDMLAYLQQNVRRNLAKLAKVQGKRINVDMIPPELRDCQVICNEIALKGLWELLENAITYADPETIIYLRISQMPHLGQGNSIRFHFRNKGAIPEGVLRTYRHIGSAQNMITHGSANRGIGLGLAMAFVAITRAGGSMSVTNQDGCAVVEVYLPEASNPTDEKE